MWIIFAILSAVFAALTSILAKIGIDGVNSNLATAIPSISPQAGLGMADKSSISSPMEKREIPSTLN